jgi:protoporphyrinogen oxidase
LKKPKVAILGAGLAGLGAASELGNYDAVIYEMRQEFGGHASSREVEGFVFDEGPHISFTKNEEFKRLLADSVGGQFRELPGIAHNYFEGHILKHPAQCHLFPLPVDIKAACLIDFVKARAKEAETPRTYREWCYAQFGETFSEQFVRRYTRKYWTVALEQLTTDWVGPRIHPPSIEQVIDGALREQQQNYNYISAFRYPKNGGFAAFCKGLAEGKNIKYGYKASKIDTKTRRLHFANGKVEEFDALISSIPLPELIPLLPSVPGEVREAAQALQCTSHFLVNLGIKGELLSEAYWIYYYDEDIPFSRVSFPSRFSPNNAPPGCWSLQAEIVYSKFRPLGDTKSVTEQTIDTLLKIGLLPRRDDIVLVDTQDIRYANVIFNLERVEHLRCVHDYLRSQGIAVCGRYGEWAYLWTDESFQSGQRAGRKIREALSGMV